MGTAVTLSGGISNIVGMLSYGSVQFEELFKSKMTGRAEWDRARRSVKYVRYILEVDGYVISTNSLPNDPTWARMRHVLQQPGLALRYSDRGFANFNINTDLNNGLVDVCNGPRPEILEFTPIGARLAAHVVWRCEICIPEVAGGNAGGLIAGAAFQSPFSQGVLAFNWLTELNFKDDGYADYRVEGELEVARVRGVPENLERYRAYTEPLLPAGFKPTKRSFKTDDAKRQVRFLYAYEELPPMGIPIRCTGARGRYRVSCSRGPALINWTAHLQATYITVPTGPRREAYMRFLGLLRDRIDHVRRNSVPVVANRGTNVAGGGGGLDIPGIVAPILPGSPLRTFVENLLGRSSNTGAGGSKAGFAMIRSFVIDEGLYEDSKSSSFECSWTFVTSFESVFEACGAWRKMYDCAGSLVDGRDVWVSDMASIVGYTSWYNYGFRPQAEVIISPNDRRLGPATAAVKNLQTGFIPADDNRATAGAGLVRTGVDPDSGASPDASVNIPGLPSPEASWLNYHIEFVTDLDPGMAVHKPLPQSADEVDSLGSLDPFATNPESNTTSGVNTVSRSSAEDIVQRMATSTYRVGLRGFGVRAGYKVPVPDLKVFGGSVVSPAQQRVVGPRVVANYSGVPVYLTAWLLWYDVPVPPRANQPAPPDLAQHIGEVTDPPVGVRVPISIPEIPVRAGEGLPPLSTTPPPNAFDQDVPLI